LIKTVKVKSKKQQFEKAYEKEKAREEFYKKVQNVPIKDEHQMQLYQHCKYY
jgi:hypothetical protein